MPATITCMSLTLTSVTNAFTIDDDEDFTVSVIVLLAFSRERPATRSLPTSGILIEPSLFML